MARDEKDHIPTWDGTAANWEDIETDVELYVDGTPPRIAAHAGHVSPASSLDVHVPPCWA